MRNGGDWTLIYDCFEPEEEGLREALCTLGNGYFAARGAFPEVKANDVHYPGTYLAGGYNRLVTEISGRAIENEDLVNLPNWLCLTFRIEGSEWFQIRSVDLLEFRQELHLKEGILSRYLRFKDAKGRITSLEEKRFVHMEHEHLAAIEWTLIPENWKGRIEICSALDGTAENSGVARYRELNSKHLQPCETGFPEEGMQFLKVETKQSELRVALTAKTGIYRNNGALSLKGKNIEGEGYTAQHFTFDVSEGDVIGIEKTVALYTSRDHAISECGLESIDAARTAPRFSELLKSHTTIWNFLWEEFDIEIETDEKHAAQHPLLILRLHIFHLLETVSLNSLDLDIGVPARGWHGEAYRGHVFWDELFIFPILNLRIPKITSALLKYRYRRLGEARKLAREEGYKGAMYPWQSGSNGREESQKVHLNPKSGRWIPDHSNIQRHVNLAIAYNFWRYFAVAEDVDFLRSYGAEVILEIARFFADLCTYNKELDRYEIHGVMGPDEYHDAYPGSDKPGLSNNAYTNVMTVWLLMRALDLLKILPDDHHRELVEMLELSEEEMSKWEEITRKMRIVFHGEGIISQFEGYEKLKEFPWKEYKKKYGDIQRLDRILEAEGDTANRYQVSKQADLLMLFYLFSAEELESIFERLGYPFDPEMIPKNIDYYIKRTSHGSTLSRVVHSWVLAREDRPASWDLFLGALESDVRDVQGGTTPEGIHLGAMSGTVDLIQRCYTGIEIREGVLWFNPALPDPLKKLRLHLHYRGHALEVELTHETLRVTARYSTAEKLLIGYNSEMHAICPGERMEFQIAPHAVKHV